MSSFAPILVRIARSLRVCLAALLLGSVLTATAGGAPARAPVDPKTRSAARKLGAEGILLYRRGDWAQALDRFERAYKLMAVPTLGLRSARCLAKLGRLVEASERYLEVTRLPLGRGAPWVHRKAQMDAAREREQVLPRIGSLEVRLVGPTGKGVRVWVDDERIAEELVGASFPADPGTHRVRAERADARVDAAVTLPEGGHAQAVLQLPPLPPPPQPPPPPPPPGGGFDWTAWTWVAFGVGAGGVTAGAISGGLALGQQSDLEQRCPGRVCPPDAHAAADVYDATRVATSVGLAIGGVGLTTALVLWLAAPETAKDGTTGDVGWLGRAGPTGAVVRF